MIDVLWVGQGEPWQLAPRPTSPYANDKLAEQYTEYDVKKANEYLDKALPKKDANGMRLMPDGKPDGLHDGNLQHQQEWSDSRTACSRSIGRLSASTWTLKVEQLHCSCTPARTRTNSTAMVWGGDGGLSTSSSTPVLPLQRRVAVRAELWQYWYNKDPPWRGAAGGPVKKQMDAV